MRRINSLDDQVVDIPINMLRLEVNTYRDRVRMDRDEGFGQKQRQEGRADMLLEHDAAPPVEITLATCEESAIP